MDVLTEEVNGKARVTRFKKLWIPFLIIFSAKLQKFKVTNCLAYRLLLIYTFLLLSCICLYNY